MLTALGVLFGTLITLLTARFYYERASKDLYDEAAELRRLNWLMLRALEEAGLCEFTNDENGHMEGLKIALSGQMQASSSMTASPTITKAGVSKSTKSQSSSTK